MNENVFLHPSAENFGPIGSAVTIARTAYDFRNLDYQRRRVRFRLHPMPVAQHTDGLGLSEQRVSMRDERGKLIGASPATLTASPAPIATATLPRG